MLEAEEWNVQVSGSLHEARYHIVRKQLGGKHLTVFITRCNVPFSECTTEEHSPDCRCRDNFNGNGTDVCVPIGFDMEENKRGYRMFDEEYLEWKEATKKCQELGARLPVLSDVETIKIVQKYMETAVFDIVEVTGPGFDVFVR